MKHYLNTKLKSKISRNGDKSYVVYCQIVVKRKAYRFKSKLIHHYLSEIEFNEVTTYNGSGIFKLFRKDKEIIEFLESKYNNSESFILSNFLSDYHELTSNILTEIKNILKNVILTTEPASFKDASMIDLLVSETLGNGAYSPEEYMTLMKGKGNRFTRADLTRTSFPLDEYCLTRQSENNSLGLTLIFDWLYGNLESDFTNFTKSNFNENARLPLLLDTINTYVSGVKTRLNV